MNILVFSWRDPKHPLAGGAEQVMHEHMKGWISSGHKVTLFSSKFPGSKKEEKLDNVQIIRKGAQYLGVQWQGFLYYLKNKSKADFVIDQFHGLPFLTPLYVRKPKLAVIQETAREVWFLNPLPWPLNWIIGAVGYLSEPLIFLIYRRTPFMTGSESAKDDVTRFGIPKKNITVVPHGVIVRRPSPLPKKEKRDTVVFLGVLSKDKGIEDALKCFAHLARKGDFQFWVIGRAETEGYRKRLEKAVLDFGLKDRVNFWGFVNQSKKFELLARAHLLVNPSVREGWGLVNIESNAMATPVVAYRSPGLIDSIKQGQSGIFCKNNTPEELAKVVFNLLKSPDVYTKLQKGSFEWSKNFSWEESCKDSLRLIEKIGI